MKILVSFLLTIASIFINVSESVGESADLKASLNLIEEASRQKNFPKATKELEWINVELQKGHKAALKELLPASILEFKIQESTTPRVLEIDDFKQGPRQIFSSSVYWASTTQHYRNDSGQNIVVALADNWNPQSRGVYQQKCSLDILKTTDFETMRIQGRIVSVQRSAHQGINDVMTICLRDGLVAVEANQKEVAARFREIAEALKVDGIDKYLSGTN